MCHPCTKTISKEPLCVPSQATDCFIQQPIKAQLQQCEGMNLKNFIEIVLFSQWIWIQTHSTHLVTTAYSLCEMGVKWGRILVPSPDSVSPLGEGNRGGMTIS